MKKIYRDSLFVVFKYPTKELPNFELILNFQGCTPDF